jgi:hypothetical protein
MLHFAKIEATSGDNVIVAGSTYPNKQIRVLSYTVLSDADVSLTWKSDTTGLSGAMPIAAKGGITATSNFLAPGGPLGLFQTKSGEDLVLNLSGTANVGGHLTYYVLNN